MGTRKHKLYHFAFKGLVALTGLLPLVGLAPNTFAEGIKLPPLDRPLGGPQVYTIGAKQSLFRFFIQSGLHGDEKLPPEFVKWLMTRIHAGESPLNSIINQDSSIDFLPEANPEGLKANTRLNEQGVNLNRNFSILWGMSRENPGKESFSEKQTQFIKSLFQERQYVGAVDVHGYINWIVAPSPNTLVMEKHKSATLLKKREAYKAWVNALSKAAKMLPDYELRIAGFLGDGGAFEDWAYWEMNANSFCLEMSRKDRLSPSGEDLFLAYEKMITSMFQYTLDELKGVKASG